MEKKIQTVYVKVSVADELPPINKKVICLNNNSWVTKGRVRDTASVHKWSVDHALGLDLSNATPTHWLNEQEAYLYTPEEHQAVQQALLEEFTKGVKAGLESPNAAAALFPNAAVQGYREALEKIVNSPIPYNDREMKSWYNTAIQLAMSALSKAEDKWDWLDELKHQIESWLESNHFNLGGDQKYIDVRELMPFIKSLKP